MPSIFMTSTLSASDLLRHSTSQQQACTRDSLSQLAAWCNDCNRRWLSDPCGSINIIKYPRLLLEVTQLCGSKVPLIFPQMRSGGDRSEGPMAVPMASPARGIIVGNLKTSHTRGTSFCKAGVALRDISPESKVVLYDRR